MYQKTKFMFVGKIPEKKSQQALVHIFLCLVNLKCYWSIMQHSPLKKTTDNIWFLCLPGLEPEPSEVISYRRNKNVVAYCAILFVSKFRK